jgi:hypothetical protein
MDSQPDSVSARASRLLHGAAALLGLSVLADSALEHYRGRFENPGMFAPLLVSLATVASGLQAWREPLPTREYGRIYATASAVGAAGLAFHAYDLWRRPGRLSWQNLFYAAPLAAPGALVLAGLYGQAAQRLASEGHTARLAGLPAGPALAALTGAGLASTAAEAALLHFRGAFQHRAMWLPVTLAPLAAVSMLRAAVRPAGPVTRRLLAATAMLGVAGVAFHARGVGRQMGGWRNWRQNLLSGPPLPAPPSLLALALAGRAAFVLSARRG